MIDDPASMFTSQSEHVCKPKPALRSMYTSLHSGQKPGGDLLARAVLLHSHGNRTITPR